MAKRRKKGGLLFGLAAVALLGALAYTALFSGGSSVQVADPGGGRMSPSSPPPPPYPIRTLGAIGTAAQDPGGGGGGTGAPGNVGPPGIQGAQGSGSAQGQEASGDTLYFSGPNLLEPTRSAITSGQTTFPSAGSTAGGVLTPVVGTSGGGCSNTADSVSYVAIPLQVETIGWNGAPQVHIRITGGGPIFLTLYQQTPSGVCQAITSGSGTISGGIADVTLGARKYQFPTNYTPSLAIRAPEGSHTITTDGNNPSTLRLPGLYGI